MNIRICTILWVIAVSGPVPAGAFTLEEAIARTLAGNRELASVQKAHAAAICLTEQAVRGPNPELELELENLGIAEAAVMLTQPLELGGKKEARRSLADIETRRVLLEQEELKLSLQAETARRFLAVLVNRDQDRILEEALTRAGEIRSILAGRHQAGAVGTVDLLRAERETDQISLERKVVQRERLILVRSLWGMWTQDPEPVLEVAGSINTGLQLPGLTDLEQACLTHPAVRLGALEQEAARAERASLSAEAVPDLEISAGYVRNNERQENSFILAAGLPLPLFDRNLDAKNGQESRIEAAGMRGEQALQQRAVEINRIYGEIAALEEELEIIRASLLPKTEKIFEQLKEYHTRGAVSLLDLLEIRAELQELENRRLELSAERAELCIDLWEMTGHGLEIIVSY